MYQVEHNELFAAIRAGKRIDNSQYMAKSTMVAIMGRMATYTGQKITWDQAMNSKEDLSPAKYEWGGAPDAGRRHAGDDEVCLRRFAGHFQDRAAPRR